MTNIRKSALPKPPSLSVFIRHDLSNRIDSGELGPEDLSLQVLASHYAVSFTPLRRAINELLEMGYLTKLANRRLQVNPRRRGKAKPRIKPQSPPTPGDWDKALLMEVVDASLGRRPAYLREDSLSRKLEVGRSVMRQALSRFAGAGLIEHIPRHGWFVHPLGVEDMRAYLEIREMLEIKALRLARPSIEMADLKRIRKICAKGKKGGKLDSSIHDHIIDRSGNRYIRQFFQQYIARYYTELFYMAAPKTRVVGEMARQHLGIIDALLAGRWAQAEKLLAEHIWAQAAVLVKLLDKKKR